MREDIGLFFKMWLSGLDLKGQLRYLKTHINFNNAIPHCLFAHSVPSLASVLSFIVISHKGPSNVQ